MTDLRAHIEWRKLNVPIPILNDQILSLLNEGIVYIHGRCIDQSPILIMDFGKLSELLNTGRLTPQLFCNLHNFYARYIQNNMLLPGQVEKWIILTNLNGFPLKEMPIELFK